MITFKRGNIFDEPVDALVNPVNCVGVMGKGLALEFKKRWPDYFFYYRKMCEQRMLRMGAPALYHHLDPSIWIVSFPTKNHWKDRSDRSDRGLINVGLGNLLFEMSKTSIKSIAFPALGCGLGGLDYETDVKPLFVLYEKYAQQAMPGLHTVVFEPQ